MRKEQAIVTSLWIFATWFVDVSDFVPYILITSKTKEYGKSRLLEFLAHTVRVPVKTGDTTAGAVIRIMAQGSPTLLLDETDQYIRNREGSISILNDGNSRSGVAIRAAGNAKGGFTDDVKTYNCFGSKAIVGIRADHLQETVTSRSIVIELQRKPRTRGQRIKIQQFEKEFLSIKSRIYTLGLRYADQVGARIENGTIKFPKIFTDRQIDGYEPLWAMLECMANEKAQKVGKKACKLCLPRSDRSPE